MRDLWEAQRIFSEQTFGDVGPIGALEHLKLEAQEAIEAPGDLVEYADCLLLLIDACRRAGFSYADVVRAAGDKIEINKRRKWHTPVEGRPCGREKDK